MSRHLLVSAFSNPGDTMEAVAGLRQAGFTVADVYAPYPVHGLERAAGLTPSRLGWVAAAGGFVGAGSILYFQHWTSAVDWALNVGGKPFSSIPAFIPVTFEVGVLLAALGAVATLLVRSRLYPGKKARLIDPRVTDDHFVVVLEARDAGFDGEEAARLCRRHHAVSVEERRVSGAEGARVER